MSGTRPTGDEQWCFGELSYLLVYPCSGTDLRYSILGRHRATRRTGRLRHTALRAGMDSSMRPLTGVQMYLRGRMTQTAPSALILTRETGGRPPWAPRRVAAVAGWVAPPQAGKLQPSTEVARPAAKRSVRCSVSRLSGDLLQRRLRLKAGTPNGYAALLRPFSRPV